MKTCTRLGALLFISGIASAQGAFDESWTITLAGQTAPVSADGTFVLPNVSAPDLFGAGGPGTGPDFLSDDFVQAIATRTVEGLPTRWAFTDGFRFRTDLPIELTSFDWTFTDTPPVVPELIFIEPLNQVSGILSNIGDKIQMEVRAFMGDRSMRDVTLEVDWTTYRTSNPAILQVDPDGEVEAIGCGSAFITATNRGVTGVTLVQVLEGVTLGDVEGVCRIAGMPAPIAFVNVLGSPVSMFADSNGHFSISGVPFLEGAPLRVRAELLVGTDLYTGVSDLIYPEEGFIADTGLIDMVLQSGLTNPSFEQGSLAGYSSAGNAQVLMNVGNVVPPDGVYMGKISTAPSGVGGTITASILTRPAGVESVAFDFNFMTAELSNPAVYNDTFVITAIPTIGPPVEILRVTVDDLRSGVWPHVDGPLALDGMTNFLPLSIPLDGLAAEGESLAINFAVFDVGDNNGETIVLLDNLRWE